MSETVHYQGTAMAVQLYPGESAQDRARKILLERGMSEIPRFYNGPIEYLVDKFYEEFFFHKKTNTLYYVSSKEVDADGDIIRAEESDGLIRFELRFYNGGASFDECLSKAIDNLK